MDLAALHSNFAPHLVETLKHGIRSASSFPSLSMASALSLDWQPLKRLTDAESRKLVQAYQDGENVASLANRFNVNRCTVHEHLDKAGIVRRILAPTLSPHQINKAAELYATGLSTKVVGERLGVNGTTIATHLKRAGYELRPRRGWRESDGPV